MMLNTPVNTAVFTCSICGEASSDICAYCTKDACTNHRCVRCKRCSDCCECEFPLSADEAVAAEVVVEPASEPTVALQEPEATFVEPVALPPAEPGLLRVSSVAPFLTPEEASVFSGPFEPLVAPTITNFAPEHSYPEHPDSEHPDSEHPTAETSE